MVEASRLSCVIVLPVDTACKHIRALKFFQSPPLMTYREYATTSSAQYNSSRSSVPASLVLALQSIEITPWIVLFCNVYRTSTKLEAIL
jgi:hypothetical protein